MNCIVFGANSSLGTNIIEELSKKNYKILSISRSEVIIRKKNIEHINYNKIDKEFFDKYYKVVDNFFNKKIDVFFYLATIRDEEFEINHNNLNLIDEIFNVNSINCIKFIEYNLSKLLFKKTHIAFTSTVSTFLNLKKNIYYGSNKLQTEFFLKSLSLKYPNLNVCIYKLGYINTKKNIKKKLFFPKSKIINIRNFIIKGIFKHNGTKIYPYFWIIIYYIIKITPKKLIYFFYK
tara:strand:+ start:424 stop:1125 length:702 start_codon:yes stop_codon:yes gene_type:complete